MASGGEEQLNFSAFEQLVEEYADRVYAVALRITGSPTDAEDVMQDAFLKAFEERASFRGESSPTTWIYRIAVNSALTLIRSRRPTEPLLNDAGDDVAPVVDWSSDLTRDVELDELRRTLEAAIARLPDDVRVAVVLRDVEGFTTAETARILDLSEAAVKSRLHRGRLILRNYLTRYLDIGDA